MLAKPMEPRIRLPKGWQGCVQSAVLYAIALAVLLVDGGCH